MTDKKELELRMYFFVPYNISPIQQGIQAGHASLEYARLYGNTKLFKDFIDNHKTWIILNGGTTNDEVPEDHKYYGSLNKIRKDIFNNNIELGFFREPDLSSALTAVCFIADERVFNWEDYPDFKSYLISDAEDIRIINMIKKTDVEELKKVFEEQYNKWLELIGGPKNEFLKDLIKNKKLA